MARYVWSEGASAGPPPQLPPVLVVMHKLQHDLYQPKLRAGDLLLIASPTLRGLLPWKGPGAQLLFSAEFTAAAVVPSGGYIETPQLSPLGAKWATELSAAAFAEVGQRLTGRDGALQLTDDSRTEVMDRDSLASEEAAHDAALMASLAQTYTGCNPYELWFWTTFGFLVVPDLMGEEWLRRCNTAVDEMQRTLHEDVQTTAGHDVVYKRNGDSWPADTSAKLRGGGASDGSRRVLYGMYDWPEPHGAAFRECVAHPEVVVSVARALSSALATVRTYIKFISCKHIIISAASVTHH